jgi:hypothetical protein
MGRKVDSVCRMHGKQETCSLLSAPWSCPRTVGAVCVSFAAQDRRREPENSETNSGTVGDEPRMRPREEPVESCCRLKAISVPVQSYFHSLD